MQKSQIDSLDKEGDLDDNLEEFFQQVEIFLAP